MTGGKGTFRIDDLAKGGSDIVEKVVIDTLDGVAGRERCEPCFEEGGRKRRPEPLVRRHFRESGGEGRADPVA